MAAKSKKVALCFLVQHTMACEQRWVDYLAAADPAEYNVYIHVKHRDRSLSDWVKQYMVPVHVPTVWGTASLVDATNTLFGYAHDHDQDNQVFILLSESCVPVKPLSAVRDYFFRQKPGTSVLPQAPESQCFPRCNTLLQYFPRDCIAKHAQWIILQRHLVAALKDSPMLWCFEAMTGPPDEHYYLTMLRYLKLLDNSVELCQWPCYDQQPTFVYWPDMDKRYPYRLPPDPSQRTPHPHTYTSMSTAEWDYLAEQCQPFPFFLRKVAPGFSSSGSVGSSLEHAHDQAGNELPSTLAPDP
jgi:hypothetical protein